MRVTKIQSREFFRVAQRRTMRSIKTICTRGCLLLDQVTETRPWTMWTNPGRSLRCQLSAAIGPRGALAVLSKSPRTVQSVAHVERALAEDKMQIRDLKSRYHPQFRVLSIPVRTLSTGVHVWARHIGFSSGSYGLTMPLRESYKGLCFCGRCQCRSSPSRLSR